MPSIKLYTGSDSEIRLYPVLDDTILPIPTYVFTSIYLLPVKPPVNIISGSNPEPVVIKLIAGATNTTDIWLQPVNDIQPSHIDYYTNTIIILVNTALFSPIVAKASGISHTSIGKIGGQEYAGKIQGQNF